MHYYTTIEMPLLAFLSLTEESFFVVWVGWLWVLRDVSPDMWMARENENL